MGEAWEKYGRGLGSWAQRGVVEVPKSVTFERKQIFEKEEEWKEAGGRDG